LLSGRRRLFGFATLRKITSAMIGMATVINIKVIMSCMGVLDWAGSKRNSNAKVKNQKNPSLTFRLGNLAHARP